MEHINNLRFLKPLRKKLRNKGTSAEARLWTFLQHSKIDGRKFRRQHSVGRYILDFYCPGEMLCIELDGAYHNSIRQQLYDRKRTEFLNSVGIRVIRFENRLVFENIDKVIGEIRKSFSQT